MVAQKLRLRHFFFKMDFNLTSTRWWREKRLFCFDDAELTREKIRPDKLSFRPSSVVGVSDLRCPWRHLISDEAKKKKDRAIEGKGWGEKMLRGGDWDELSSHWFSYIHSPIAQVSVTAPASFFFFYSPQPPQWTGQLLTPSPPSVFSNNTAPSCWNDEGCVGQSVVGGEGCCVPFGHEDWTLVISLVLITCCLRLRKTSEMDKDLPSTVWDHVQTSVRIGNGL